MLRERRISYAGWLAAGALHGEARAAARVLRLHRDGEEHSLQHTPKRAYAADSWLQSRGGSTSDRALAGPARAWAIQSLWDVRQPVRGDVMRTRKPNGLLQDQAQLAALFVGHEALINSRDHWNF